MKKLIALFILISVAIGGYSQEKGTSQSNERTKTNATKQKVNVIKETLVGTGQAVVSGEALETAGEFAYGFLKQGVNTAVGMGGTVMELPSNLVLAFKEYSDVNSDAFLYWGEYTLESIGESVKSIYDNIKSGDPERIGEASFDAFYTIASVKGGVKSAEPLSKVGKNLANKYGPKYHYTSNEAARSIQKTGLKTDSKGKAYATYDGSLSGTEAKTKLALPQKDPPTMRVTIDNNVKPREIRKVEEAFGQPGGGIEQVFYEEIPADKILSVDPIPKEPTMTTKAIRMIGESSNRVASYTTPVVGPLVAKENSQNNNEGGHKLNAQINTVVFIEESINPGKVLFFEKDEIKFIGINSIDIERITPVLLGKISGENVELSDTSKKRNREVVVPLNNRTQRGL